MNERCSAVLLDKLPLKEKDLESFTIPCRVLEKHKETEDLVADHSSRLENPHKEVLTKREIANEFSDEHLMALKSKFNNDEPWYADFVNYIVGKVVPPNWTFEKRKRFFSQVKSYFWEEPYAFKLCADNIMRRCVTRSETFEILAHCHSGPTGGHHSANVTAKKVCEVFDVWGLDFMGPFPESRGNKYILVVVYYVSKWVEARALLTYDARVVVKFLRSLFARLRGDKDFKVGDQVLLYNSHLKMYPGKLKSKWSGPNIVKTVYPHGAIEITDRDGFSFKVNGQRLKKYYGDSLETDGWALSSDIVSHMDVNWGRSGRRGNNLVRLIDENGGLAESIQEREYVASLYETHYLYERIFSRRCGTQQIAIDFGDRIKHRGYRDVSAREIIDFVENSERDLAECTVWGVDSGLELLKSLVVLQYNCTRLQWGGMVRAVGSESLGWILNL
ncbi:reverse transcriptase domain-containing protein [Tanacetum coccineum]